MNHNHNHDIRPSSTHIHADNQLHPISLTFTASRHHPRLKTITHFWKRCSWHALLDTMASAHAPDGWSLHEDFCWRSRCHASSQETAGCGYPNLLLWRQPFLCGSQFPESWRIWCVSAAGCFYIHAASIAFNSVCPVLHGTFCTLCSLWARNSGLEVTSFVSGAVCMEGMHTADQLCMGAAHLLRTVLHSCCMVSYWNL